MQRQVILAGLTATLAAFALLLVVAVPGDKLPEKVSRTTSNSDPVVQQFEREMNREPTPRAPVERTSIDEDELYRQANRIHWTDEEET